MFSRLSLALLILALPASGAVATPIVPVPYKVISALPDAVHLSELSQVSVQGWLGERIDANERNRLLVVDTEPLLAGYLNKPGKQEWIGEHVGKWLDAATLAWAYSGDPALKRKLDRTAAQLIGAQEADGYLGTYLPAQRFGLFPGADWDVWSHAYNMIGLLSYYRYTGNEAALNAVRRMGDLLIATFPSQKSILAAGTHEGMAATSVLEPVVELYRLTGDLRYLAFAQYIVRAYDEPGGPAIVQTLLAAKGVSQTANGKAYEMLANLMGICDLARVTGDRRLLTAVTNAWGDIVRYRLYITGTSSAFEHFARDHDLPNSVDDQLGETCVTTTWIQLNMKLLELTGGAAYADEVERSLYNHLSAAQNPRGDDWCYYTALEGTKHYDTGITCCHSSGPRAMALAPAWAYLQGEGSLYVNTFEPSRVRARLDGQDIELVQESGFPRSGQSVLIVHTRGEARFGLRIRVPDWAVPLRVGDQDYGAGWATLPSRLWRNNDQITYAYNLRGRVIRGEYSNYSRAAFAWGPFVLAADATQNPNLGSLEALQVNLKVEPSLKATKDRLEFTARAKAIWGEGEGSVGLVPFADAGSSGGQYRVWMRTGE
jgi:uncharacterized protein